MKDAIVYYFSRTKNNEYLAKRVADELKCDIERIKSRNPIFVLEVLLSALKFGFGIRKVKNDPAEYKKVIVCAPLWVGSVAVSAMGFMKKYSKSVGCYHFITCCGSSDEKKNDKFGYEKIFAKLSRNVGPKLKSTTAFPIVLALPKKDRENDDLVMKTRLSDANFKDELKKRLDEFVKKIKN